ncbi:Hypothetical predicted protein [Mytilus galloprovincialis]|uniref:HMG box domain-containing protein n=1 Tax=Mytilus galloprovincialis TaxID=29158 RepID=A0A8B6ENN9_MYTGA|nr:Hypothetical predicted protein [Mytilus galloprovincialis]
MALLATCAKSGTFAFSKCGVFKLCSSSYSIGLNINRNYVTKKEKIDIHSLPKAPKRPMTSYLEFYKNHYNEIVENNNLQADKKKASKAVQICSGMWESLDDVTRKGYQDRAHVRLEAYREEMKKFKDSLTAEQKELLKEAKKQIREEKIKKKEKKEEKQRNAEHGLPKRPLSSYMIFVNSKMPNPYSDKSATEFVQMLGHEWKEMSKQEKQFYLRLRVPVWISIGTHGRYPSKEKLPRDIEYLCKSCHVKVVKNFRLLLKMKRSITDFFPSKRHKGNDCVDINGNAIDESPSPTSSCYDKDQHSEEKEPEPGSSTETATHPTSSSVNEQSQSSKDYISMPNEKSYGPWNFKQCKTNVEDLFENKAVHSFFTCKDADCSTIHTDSQIFKKFKHSWLNSKNWWLCFVENDGMFCLVCKKHQMKHPQNQRSVFASTPSVRFKIDSLNTHVQSKLHIAALQNELLQQVSVFHQEVIKKTEVNNTVLNQVFSSAYFLMKEFVANKKLLPLLQFIEKIFEVEHLKFFQHRSARSQTEIFRTLGDVMKEIMLENVRKSNAFGLMTDEVADISVKENLVTFIQYYSFKDEETKTNFLSCKDILEKHNAANAETITGLLLEELESDKLDVSKLTGFSSDGASVMVGKRTGVATRLREKNPCLINIHCVCHKLALSCADSNESISFIKNMEIILRQLWQLFENSPKKMAIYLKTQKELKNITMGDKAQKVVSKRLKKACRTRWLSLESSVKAVFSEYEVILHTLSKLEKDDAAACGLLKKDERS